MGYKKKYLTAQTQLENCGVEIEQLKRRINEAFRNPTGVIRNYMSILSDIDRQQFVSRYKWEGLPDYIPNNLLERLFYYRGSFVGFFHGGTLHFLPYANCGDLNIYGYPTKVQPVTFNGKDVVFRGLELNTYANGSENKNAKGVLFFDRTPVVASSTLIPQAVLNRSLVELEDEILRKANINLINSAKKGLIKVANSNQRATVLKEINESLADDSPYLVTSDESLTGSETEVFNNGIGFEGESYAQFLATVNNIRCYAMGVKNSGMFEKSDRVVIGELSGDEYQTNLILESGLQMRLSALEQLKKLYPQYSDVLSKITVKINDEPYQNKSADDIETSTDKSENSPTAKEVNNV